MAATLGTNPPAEVPESTGLEVRDLKVFHGVVPAVRGVDLDCKPGQILGIVGPNGAGKTSLLSGISGIKKTSGGHVLLDGQDMSRWPAYRRGPAGRVVGDQRPPGV